MEISLQDIQSIKAAVYEINEKGSITQLRGSNSNGKSVLIKFIASTVKLEIMNQKVRDSLIQDHKQSGTGIITYQDKVLHVNLDRERSACYVMLKRANGEIIKRTFRENGLHELISEFGFCMYNSDGLCLQIYETFGPMPFVNTSLPVNGEIVKSITTDSVADEFIQNYREITYPMARKRVTELKGKLEILNAKYAALRLYNVEAYQKRYKEMHEVYDVLKNLVVMELGRIPIPPAVSVLDMEAPELKLIPIRQAMPSIAIKKEDVIVHITKMKTIREGECPTCGKRLLSKCVHGGEIDA